MAFARDVEPRIRLALVAAYGPDPGLDATQEALIWAWEHWDQVAELDNPGGYLYRIAMRRASRHRLRRRFRVRAMPGDTTPWVEPGLLPALQQMSRMQRQVVVLVAAYGYSQSEAATLLGVSRSTVQTHLERGLARLRESLGVNDNA